MKILKLILSQLLIIFNMIPDSTRKEIAIHLLEKASKSTKNKVDDNIVSIVKDKWK